MLTHFVPRIYYLIGSTELGIFQKFEGSIKMGNSMQSKFETLARIFLLLYGI